MYSAMMHAFSKTNCAINGRVLKITLCNAPSPLFLWCHLKSSQFDLLAKSEMPQASPTGGMAACFSQNCEKNEAAEMCPNTCTFCSKLFTVSEKRTRSKFYLEGQLILWVINWSGSLQHQNQQFKWQTLNKWEQNIYSFSTRV